MGKTAVIPFIMLMAFSLQAQDYRDVLNLKNGGLIKGIIIENIANDHVKIKIEDGSIAVYPYTEIETSAKEVSRKSDKTDGSQSKDNKFKFTINTGFQYPNTADLNRELAKDESEFRAFLPLMKKWDENYSDKTYMPMGFDLYYKFNLYMNRTFFIGLGYSYDEIMMAKLLYWERSVNNLPVDLTYSTLDTFDKYEAKFKSELFKENNFSLLAGSGVSINHYKHYKTVTIKEYTASSAYKSYAKTSTRQYSKALAPGYSLELDMEYSSTICGSKIIFGAGGRYDWVRYNLKGTMSTTVIQPSGTLTQTSTKTHSKINLDCQSVLIYVGLEF